MCSGATDAVLTALTPPTAACTMLLFVADTSLHLFKHSWHELIITVAHIHSSTQNPGTLLVPCTAPPSASRHSDLSLHLTDFGALPTSRVTTLDRRQVDNSDGARGCRTCFPLKHGKRMEWDNGWIQLAYGMESLSSKESKKFIRKKGCTVGGRAFMTHQRGVNSVIEQL